MKKTNTPKWIHDFVMKFATRIDVEITLDAFTFTRDHQVKTFKTFIYVSTDTGASRIESVGETPLRQGAAQRIDLFEDSEYDSVFEDKYDRLASFLMYCLKVMSPRFAMLRPSVHITGARKLAPVLNGFEDKVLIDGFSDAGAAWVFIEDQPHSPSASELGI